MADKKMNSNLKSFARWLVCYAILTVLVSVNFWGYAVVSKLTGGYGIVVLLLVPTAFWALALSWPNNG